MTLYTVPLLHLSGKPFCLGRVHPGRPWAAQAYDITRCHVDQRSDQANDHRPHSDSGQAYRQKLPRDATVVAAEDSAPIGPSVDALRVAGIPIDGYHHIVV